MARAQRVQKRTVALVEKQDPVDVVGFAKVGRQPGPEATHIRMEETQRAGPAALQIDLSDFFHSWHIGPKDVFDGAEQLHLPLFCPGEDRSTISRSPCSGAR